MTHETYCPDHGTDPMGCGDDCPSRVPAVAPPRLQRYKLSVTRRPGAVDIEMAEDPEGKWVLYEDVFAGRR